MRKYLGEKVVPIEQTPFAGYNTTDWIMYFIEQYSQIDGAHHKQWLIDTISRLCLHTPVEVKLAEWEGQLNEWRVQLRSPTNDYNQWVWEWNEVWGGYDAGVAP